MIISNIIELFDSLKKLNKTLEVEIQKMKYLNQLSKFLKSNNSDFFVPHGFELKDLVDIFRKATSDSYHIILIDNKIVGYGMLRGYDEGFTVPSLGIIIDKKYSGTGLSSLFMHYLEQVAKLDNSKQMRLTVFKENAGAVKFFEKMGYKLEEFDEKKYLGYKNL